MCVTGVAVFAPARTRRRADLHTPHAAGHAHANAAALFSPRYPGSPEARRRGAKSKQRNHQRNRSPPDAFGARPNPGAGYESRPRRQIFCRSRGLITETRGFPLNTVFRMVKFPGPNVLPLTHREVCDGWSGNLDPWPRQRFVLMCILQQLCPHSAASHLTCLSQLLL